MAISISIDTLEPVGNSYLFTGSFVPDNSWLAAGEAFAISDTAQHDVKIERVAALWGGGGGYVLQFNKASQLVLLYYGDNNNASDGPLIAVPDTTDLSAVTIQFAGVGQ